MIRASATAAHGVKAGLLACALLLLAAPAAWAGAWLPEQDLSAPGRSANNPVVAMADDGATTALWEKKNFKDSGSHGEVVTREPSQQFSPPSELVGGITDPQLEMTGGGEAVAAWKRLINNPPGNYGIQVAFRPPGGAFGPPITAAELPPSILPNELSMALNDNGDVALVWTRTDPNSAKDKAATIVEAAVRPAGGSFSEPEQVSLPIEPPIEEPSEPTLHLSAVEPAVAIDPAGNVVVVWRYFDGTDLVIEASERPAGGNAFTAPPDEISAGGVDSFDPAVAVDGGGNAIAVWAEAGPVETIVKGSFRPVNDDFEAAEDISAAGQRSLEPDIAVTRAGVATVVWVSAEGEEITIQTSSRPAGGSFSSPPVDLTPVPEEISLGRVDPQLRMNDAGDAIVAWRGTASGGRAVVKVAARFGGESFPAPEEVSAPHPVVVNPGVAIDAAGNGTVVWESAKGFEPQDIRTVQAAGYDARPPQMRGLSIPATGTVGVPVSFSASPFDVWPIASTSFTFGDGAGAPGTSVTHTYSAPGTYQVIATAVDAGGAPASAGGAISISPSYAFKIGKQKRNTKKGTATLTVNVSGPGQVAVSGKKVKRKIKHAAGAGSVTLAIAAKGKALKQLNKKGKAKVRVTVTFTPDGGDHAATSAVSVTLKKKLAAQ
jgi:hypothetical protein